jgi:hypothetical protein
MGRGSIYRASTSQDVFGSLRELIAMPTIDHRARPSGPPDDDVPSGTWRRRISHRLARFRSHCQDRLWGPDEQFAAERGWTAERSIRGWSIEVRDPRFNRRHLCFACDGTGRHRITGVGCPACFGNGVVTEPEGGEPR